MSEGGNFPDLPQFDRMNFSKNCKAWGEWYTSFSLPSPWNSTHYLDGDVKAIFDLFNSSVPDEWRRPENLTDDKYHGLVLDWYGTNYYSYPDGSQYYTDNFAERVVKWPMNDCNTTRCIAFGWSGDMDLIGIGVFTSYYVEAILATILLLTYTYWRFRQPFPSYRNPVPNSSRPRIARRLILGLQESLQDFLDASKLFSIAMLAAAIYLSGKGIVQRKDFEDAPHPLQKTVLYDMFLSMLASTFSIFPVMMTSTIKCRDPPDSTKCKRRPIWLGIATLTLVWVLSVMEAIMSLYGNIDYGDDHEGDSYEETAKYMCDWRHAAHYWVGMKAAQYLLVACPLVLVLVTVFLITGFGMPGVVDKPLIAHCRRLWRLIIAWIILLVMWGILGFFTWVRHKIDATVGHLNESNEWRFGQWLALFTWVPFVHHVLTRWISGTDSEHQQQREQIHNGLQKQSDDINISTQTRNSPPLQVESRIGYTAIPVRGRAMPMDNLSNDTSFALNHEYSSLPLEFTESRRDPMEEWQATGW